MTRAVWRTVEHVGEWQVAIASDTLVGLFTEVARVIAGTAGVARGGPAGWETVVVTAHDAATLLADWANELLGRSEAAGRVYGELRHVCVRDMPNGDVEISAELRGRSVGEWRSPLKAATYHRLSLAHEGARWRATLLFDV